VPARVCAQCRAAQVTERLEWAAVQLVASIEVRAARRLKAFAVVEARDHQRAMEWLSQRVIAQPMQMQECQGGSGSVVWKVLSRWGGVGQPEPGPRQPPEPKWQPSIAHGRFINGMLP